MIIGESTPIIINHLEMIYKKSGCVVCIMGVLFKNVIMIYISGGDDEIGDVPEESRGIGLNCKNVKQNLHGRL